MIIVESQNKVLVQESGYKRFTDYQFTVITIYTRYIVYFAIIAARHTDTQCTSIKLEPIQRIRTIY